MPGGRERGGSGPGRTGWALRFLAGRYRGGTVPLESGQDMAIGRLPDADLQIPEELTSRRHARITWDGQVPVVEDLGSTNGTFVNGERVKRRPLLEGDRILVGGNILKLVTEARTPPLDGDTLPGLERAAETPAPRRQAAMQGRLEEVGLPDVLQLCGTSRKSGVLRIRSGDRNGWVQLEGGRVIRCHVDGRGELLPHDALVELLQWAEGTFDLGQVPADPIPGPAIDETVEAVLMEAMRLLDEKRKE